MCISNLTVTRITRGHYDEYMIMYSCILWKHLHSGVQELVTCHQLVITVLLCYWPFVRRPVCNVQGPKRWMTCMPRFSECGSVQVEALVNIIVCNIFVERSVLV